MLRTSLLLALLLIIATTGFAAPWWWDYPTFIATSDWQLFTDSHARLAMTGMAIDPTWGRYAQRLAELDHAKRFQPFREAGARNFSWIEGFGDVMLYALAFQQKEDGSFVMREDDPTCASGLRSHWNWAHPSLEHGNAMRWVGPHNSVNDEDFAMPAFSREAVGLPVPTYPDGAPAFGYRDDLPYPLNARVYDACCSKDINGQIEPNYDPPTGVNVWENVKLVHPELAQGLLPAYPGKDVVQRVEGVPEGEPVYCGVASLGKDLSAPFWLEYARASITCLAEQGVDGIWCDNYSPWDNFGSPPLRKAFGEWSVARFRDWLEELPVATRQQLGVQVSAMFDVRDYLKAKVTELGVADSSDLNSPVWNDRRWMEEPVWNAYKAFRQLRAQEDMTAFYRVIHEAAAEAGKPDFLIAGNDIPLFSLGWVRPEYVDMCNTELSPGWHPGTGTRGVMLPPTGKMAPMYRLALELQQGPLAAAWYYLEGENQARNDSPGLVNTLLSEAFANGTLLLADPENSRVAGDLAIHSAWNKFINSARTELGIRRPLADVAVVYSPDNQLLEMAPGGFPDMDEQPQVFGALGWGTALTDAALPYRMLPDWKLTDTELKGLRTLVLPHVTALSEEAGQSILRWVQAGGQLIVTGPLGTREDPSGCFLPREKSLGETLFNLGSDGTDKRVRRLGAGSVTWLAANLGRDYYLTSDDRPRRLPELLNLVGPSELVAGRLPSRIGLTLWRSEEGRARFVDLANYNLDPLTDALSPIGELSVRVRLPEGWSAATVRALSPQDQTSAEVVCRDGWARITARDLGHYACLKLTEVRP